MASEIDISNLALSHLGDEANISDFQEGSANADHCRMFYPMARDTLLEMHPWTFTLRRVAPAALEAVPPSTWAYAYALPADVSRAIAVLPPSAGDEYEQNFILETQADGTRVLLTNQQDAVLRYTAKIIDTSKFSALFVDTLTWLLASYVAGPLLKGQEGVKAGRDAYQTFIGQLANAKATDAKQSYETQPVISSTITARYGDIQGMQNNTPYRSY
jgi:hypothetical protein